MSEKLNNNTSDIPTKTEAVIKAPDEWKKVPEVKEMQKDTQKKLEDLKKEIQEKGISFDMTKTLLDSLENIEPENRPFILWGIFSWLNHIWISISGIDQDGKIVLHPPKIPFKAEGNFATYEDTLKYNQLFNNYILSGKVSISDVTKWLLYRTSSVDDYIKEKADNSFSTPEYVQRLLKKYKIHVEWNIKDISFWSGAEWKKQFEAFKKDISFAISDNVADKEFLLTYFDDVYYRGGKSLSSDEITAYTQKSAENQKTVLREISRLNNEQKFALWIRDSNEAKELSRDITKDPIGFLKKNMTADNISLAIIFWIIWAFLWGKKWFWIWAILWFWVWAGWLAFAQEWWNKLGEKKDQKWNKTPEQRVPTANPKENHLSSKVTFTKETDPAKKWELEKIWWELSQNDAFLKAPTSILSIFESTPTKTFEEIKAALGAYWIKLTNENKEYYKIIFAEIIKQRKSVIWEAKEKETIQEYLERTSKIETAVATWVVAWWASKSWWDSWNEKINLSKDVIEKELDNNFNSFKLKINEIDRSYHKSKEEKEKNAKELAMIYTQLYNDIEALESKKDITPIQKEKINKIKLYLAQYYWDKWEVDNDHNKNYFKSIWLALQLLPDENKPQFPWDFQLAERIKWQTWITNYISQEIIKWRDINEVLKDKKINEQIIEVRWTLVDEYEKHLETYLIRLDESKLDKTQKDALTLLKDIQWIWAFDVKESNLDIASNVWWTLVSVWAWIWTFAAWMAFIPWAWWGVWWVSALAAWAVTTAWVMITNWNNYFVDRDDWLKELTINTATFWIWWGIYKIARTIQWSEALFTSVRWLTALWVEMSWDVLLWANNDVLRGYFEWHNIPYSEAIKNNLIWWLVPLWIAWVWGSVKNFSSTRLKLAEDIVTQAKWAEFLQTIWNQSWARKVWENIFNKINRARAYDEETQNLINPLKDHLDEIRLLEDWKEKIFGNHKVKLDWDKYIFETNWSFSNSIPKSIIDEAIKWNVIKSYILQELKWKKLNSWESIDIWWVIIKKIDKWYQVWDDTTKTYKSFEEIINDINLVKPENIRSYGTKILDDKVKARIAEISFTLEWNKYFYDKQNNIFKVEDWNAWKNVDPKFVEDNFEFLFKQINWFSFKEWLGVTLKSIKSMKFKDFIKKVWWYWELDLSKKWLAELWNKTMSEILTLPKVVKQLSELKFSWNILGWSKDLMKILILWDKNRTIFGWILRAWTIWATVSLDWWIWDSNDSEITDALFYMYWWIIATAIWTALFDEN